MNRRTIYMLLLFSIFVVPNKIHTATADDVKVPFAYLYYWDLSKTIQDGIISPNEYPISFTMEDLRGNFVSKVSWAHNNVTIAIGITINGTGWLGFGLGEVGTGMAGADIIMASYDPQLDNVTIQDMHGLGERDPVIDDDQYAFSSTGGSEADGFTTIEFTIPMASNDTSGYDHFWHISSWFGFFTAFQESSKEFDVEHTSHSIPEDVKILDASYGKPTEIQQNFDVSIDETTNELVLSSTLVGQTPIDHHEVGFFVKTIFGVLKIEDVFTDENGYAETRLSITKSGDYVFTAIFFGDENHVRNEQSMDYKVDKVFEEETTGYNDLRDIIGQRFLRTTMLFGFFFVIVMLVYVYATSILSLAKINRLGKEFDQKKKAGGTKK